MESSAEFFVVGRVVASTLILVSGVTHLMLSINAFGEGRLGLSVFGAVYILTSNLILRERYAAGILVPLAGLLIGVLYFQLSQINTAFIAIEIAVMGLSVYLGYQK